MEHDVADEIESSNGKGTLPRSRQKNCDGCVRAKRRCDRKTPICSRCMERNSACTYSAGTAPQDGLASETLPSSTRRLAFGSPHSAPASGKGADLINGPAIPVDPQLEIGHPATDFLDSYMMEVPISDDILMDPFINVPADSMTPNQDLWLVPVEQQPVIERPSSPADEVVFKAYERMADFCENVDPWHLYDSTARLHYVVNRVKGFTEDIVARNATPFLHRYLYRHHTPQCIVSCFAANVLYANRTSDNTAMVMRALRSSVKELIDTEAGRAGTATPAEKLARAQALLLHQIIRLLDGDITLRAQGERDTPLLKSWLVDLCEVRDNLGDLGRLEPNSLRKQPPREWEGWIFAESMRRTIVMGLSFISLYELMKDPEQDEERCPWSFAHRWTLSRHLWEADSAYKFARMWKEKPQFIITNYSFDDFIKYGRGEDIDEFSKVLLVVYLGLDEVNELMSVEQ